MAGGPRYRAVLLDFRGILVGFRDAEWWARRACDALGREIDAEGVREIERRMEQTRELPGYAEDELRVDTSIEANRDVTLRRFREVGLEDDLALALYAYVISFEHGFQKPDPRMFTTSLEALGAMPREALMVGDRASHDGGAAEVGIDTLLLPAPLELGPRGLDVILRLL